MRVYSEVGLHKVNAWPALPIWTGPGVTASWLRVGRAGASAAFSLPREFAGLSQGGDGQVSAAASAGGHGCSGESAPLAPLASYTQAHLAQPALASCLPPPGSLLWLPSHALILPIIASGGGSGRGKSPSHAAGVPDLLWGFRPQFFLCKGNSLT